MCASVVMWWYPETVWVADCSISSLRINDTSHYAVLTFITRITHDVLAYCIIRISWWTPVVQLQLSIKLGSNLRMRDCVHARPQLITHIVWYTHHEFQSLAQRYISTAPIRYQFREARILLQSTGMSLPGVERYGLFNSYAID